ncbi:hypothetical protein [Amycolatopsis cihanbeyliensis]|uniref:Uncharacterized protein n=1 Tax=Amycolatopsis cihanbeyliensis TaxID=1128664 RepID=A0A542CTG0_AMYCI|nr:hypothetical protein [Amycolatopsis cihanbeyliensis]TQI94105.1 hypothetical protein FB471_6259 [Amycolatopsis cihanbeyliensis]
MTELPKTSGKAPDATDGRPVRRWPWLAGILAAAAVGIGIGAVAFAPEPEIVTKEVEVPGEIPAADLAALSEREAELSERDTNLALRVDELDQRSAGLDEREAAISEAERTAAANTVGDGVWVVGVDVEPGTYRATSVGAECYWAITTSGSNGGDIIDNGIPGGGNPTISLAKGQDFRSARCGEWTRQ